MNKLLTIAPKWVAVLFGVVFLASAQGVYAQDAMLTLVSGDQTVVLTEAEVLALPQAEMSTENDHYDGMNIYTGPLVRDVLALVEVNGAQLAIFTALNDYAVEIPLGDFEAYDIVLAHSMNGDRFSLRDKGPLWVVYPMSDHEELQDPVYDTRMIWQLMKVELN